MSAGLATRLGRRLVLAGVALGVVAVQSLAVAVGAVAGAVLPERAVSLASAVVFVVVGVWLWGDAGDREDDAGEGGDKDPARRRPVLVSVLAVAGTFALGELGDKTQLSTVALAARQDWTATLAGSIAGEFAANVVAIEVGARVARRVPRRVVLRVSAALFVAAGVVLAVLALT